MEISSSSIAGYAFQANSARKEVAARRETPPPEQTANGPSPAPAAAEQRETLSRLALAARGAPDRPAADLPRSSRQALDAYASQQSSLEKEYLQTAYQLAGIDQYV